MEAKKEVIIGIDLAAMEKNPTGWACWRNKRVSTCHLHRDEEITSLTLYHKPCLVAVDAPLTMPKRGITRRADREMAKHGYPVLPPLMSSMKLLTRRAISLAHVLRVSGLSVIEVHPTSTRKALGMPAKDWEKVQLLLEQIGLEVEKRELTPHEADALTAALTAYLKLLGKTMEIGDKEEGCIVVPKRNIGWVAVNE
jgi:predicted nuclease with RNAse H fold